MNQISALIRQQGERYISNILSKNKIYNAVVSMRKSDDILKDAEAATTANKGGEYLLY